MANVLITGANGHIGAHTVRAALAEGHQIKAFVRESSDLRGLEGVDVPLVYGDVLDRDSLLRAAEGCNVIVHLAAVFRIWTTNPQEIMEPAVEGTRNVFSVAKELGIKRIVYTSSIASIGNSRSFTDLRTSADWVPENELYSPYTRAKRDSERIAWELSEEYSVPMIAILPAHVVGSLDYKITPSTLAIFKWVERKSFTYRGGINYVDVRDVAYVHAKAIDTGEPGKRYIACGENIMVRDLGELLNEITGIKPLYNPGPRALGMILATINESVSALNGKPPAFSKAEVAGYVERYTVYDGSDTYKPFGYQPRSLRETLESTVEWLLEIDAFEPDTAEKIRAHREKM